MGKPYKTGMYGGKFLPMHRGHLHCLGVASSLCDRVYLVLFAHGTDEMRVRNEHNRYEYCIIPRIGQLYSAAERFGNVTPVFISVKECRTPDGSEDWDAETPMVIEKCGRFDAVFSSEPSYGEYFKRAYPWAEYVLVDPERSAVPISATMVRAMDEGEAKKWMV